MKKIILTIVISAIAVSAHAQLKIFTGGKVTIGATAAPLGSYHQVIGGIAFPSTTSSSTSSAYIRGNNIFSTDTNPDYTWLGHDRTGIFQPTPGNNIGFTINGTERMRINSSGNVQINTTSLNDATLNIKNNAQGNQRGIYLDVYQTSDYVATMTTKCYRALSSNYVVRNDGDTNSFYVAGAGWIYSQGNYLGSDMNIKDDIFTIDSAMFKINAIRGVRYKLKKEKQNPNFYGTVANEYMGVIAQDVEAVAPQVVRTLEDGTKAVCYEMLVGLLIEGMKEQNQKIDQLEKDLNNCCSKKSSSKETNNTLENNTGTSSDNSSNSYIKQNRPNPFNNQTIIDYYIKETNAKATVMIFDINGKTLKTYPLANNGKGSLTLSSNELESGIYYYSLVIEGIEIDTKKMIITK